MSTQTRGSEKLKHQSDALAQLSVDDITNVAGGFGGLYAQSIPTWMVRGTPADWMVAIKGINELPQVSKLDTLQFGF